MSQLLAEPAIPALVADPQRLAALDGYAILDTPAEEGFDDIVQLATLLCETPVGLVSLVAEDRQWFKARIGFPRCETDLNASVCAHVLAEPGLLVITDLAADPRTRRNPLVTGETHLRFYAGAPLRTEAGHTLGSLCVIDYAPRPDGLTTRQADGLRALARQVGGQLELRRLLGDRDALVREQRRTQTRLRAQSELLQTVTDHVGQAVFQLDGTGAVTFSNPAAAAMFGFTREEMLGRSLHGLVHHSRSDGSALPAERCDVRGAVLDGRLLRESPQVFFRKDGTPRDVLVTSAPVAADGGASAVLTVADVTERRAAAARLAEGEAYWRGLFERLREGLVIGQVVRDAKGSVTDWRYLDINPAWAELTGLRAADAIGHTVRELLPDIEQEWIDDVADVVDTGETVMFTRQVGQVGQLGQWFEGRISALGPDTFIILFLDVTERRRIEQALALSSERKAALARLGDHLRATMDADAMGFTAAAIVGQTLGAAQAAYATVDATGETVTIASCWCAPGADRLAGSHGFREYGSYVDALKAGSPVVVTDVEQDPRTRDGAGAFRALGIAAFINVPVVEHGELVAIFLAHFAQSRPLAREEEEFMRAAADRTRAGIARIRAEERQAILNGEISHRMKNSMAMIQGIANQTLKRVADRDAVQAFEQRLMALSTAHDVLLRTDWETADLGEVVGRALDTAGVGGHYDADGPAVTLGPRAALSTSLLLHELATNALKYGALKVAAGRIAVHWRCEGKADAEELVLDWREIGGPPVVEPTRKGFGSRLLRMGLTGTGGSEVCYRPDGLTATFRAPRKQIERA